MKNACFLAFFLMQSVTWLLHAQVPNLLSYQGRVAVGTVNFNGSGQFKFALVNSSGGTSYWSNDGTSTAGSQPAAAVALTVTKGLYSVLLGDTSLANMTAIPASVWANADVRLRVWFNDGPNGFQLLSPDQRLSPNGYLSDGSVGTGTLAANAVTAGKIAAGAVTGTQLAAGATAPPVTVSGTTQTAAPNTSYVATGSGLATFTLPASATVGDQVQITGAGTGGWTAVFSDATWTARESVRNWVPVASSSDGSKLVAAEHPGLIYTSTDAGLTWTPRASAGTRNWQALASSADGSKLVAVVYGGQIYTSTDSGLTWTARDSSRNWTSVASSADGTKLVAGTEFNTSGFAYTSADSGITWTQRGTIGQWNGIASSADGTKLVAAINGNLRTSTDSGVTWTFRSIFADHSSAASSADGTKLVAAVFGGRIYTSTDSGVNWTARESNRNWQSVASSADGTRLVAVVNGGQIYMSTDSGVTWTAQESSRSWRSVASSSDGSKLVAAVNGGRLYTWSAISTAATGANGTAATMQYLGSGQWAAVGETQIAAGAVSQAKIAAGAVGAASLAGGAVTAAKIDTTSVGLWSVTGSHVFRGAGNVGIGTNNPAQTLDVNGVSQSQALELRAVGSTPYLDFSSEQSNDFNARIILQGTAGNRLDFDAPKFSFLNGNVGIGTTNPAAKLEVFGGARLVNGTTVALQLSNYDPAFYGATTPATQIVASDVGGFTASLDFMTKAFGNQNNALQSRLHINGNTGRVGIGTTSPATALDVNGEITTVAINLTSDRNAKEQFKPVNAREVLDKVIGMPITEWQYKTEGDARHIGPMAQDFREAFALGRDERHITSVDADGVALAAIQGLNEKLEAEVKAKDAAISQLEKENRRLAERMAAIEARLQASEPPPAE